MGTYIKCGNTKPVRFNMYGAFPSDRILRWSGEKWSRLWHYNYMLSWTKTVATDIVGVDRHNRLDRLNRWRQT